jgi:hypothetical protein
MPPLGNNPTILSRLPKVELGLPAYRTDELHENENVLFNTTAVFLLCTANNGFDLLKFLALRSFVEKYNMPVERGSNIGNILGNYDRIKVLGAM